MNGDDVRGVNRLIIDGIAGVVDLVEAVHHNIAGIPGLRDRSKPPRTTGITGLVYRSIRGVAGLTGYWARPFAGAACALARGSAAIRQDARRSLAALNGVLGDYLAASSNPLAITMRCAGAVSPCRMNAPRSERQSRTPPASWSCCCTACA